MAAELVNAARSLAIWAGGGVSKQGPTELLSALAAHLQAPGHHDLQFQGRPRPDGPQQRRRCLRTSLKSRSSWREADLLLGLRHRF